MTRESENRIPAVKVIGLGGIGAAVAQAMAQFLAYEGGVEALWLIDGDGYEERNRARVRFAEAGNKALVKARELGAGAGGGLAVLGIPEYVTPRNAGRLLADGDVVFMAVDNHATRKLVSDRCRRLDDVVVISGGNDGIEAGRRGTFGNVQVYVRRGGREVTNALTRAHPEVARPADRRPDQPGCGALVAAAPQLLFTNLAVAAAMLGAFHAWRAGTLDYEELYLDIATGTMVPVKRALPPSRPPERRRPGAPGGPDR